MTTNHNTSENPAHSSTWSESVNYAIKAGIVLLTAAAYVKARLTDQ